MDLCRLPDCPVSVNSYESRLVHSVGFLVEDVKVTLYAGITIVYISHPQNYTRELLQLTNTFSDMAGYKIKKKNLSILSIYLSIYSFNKQAEKEIRKTTPFTTATNNTKYLGVTLTKQVKDLHYKSLKKEIEEDIRSWKDLMDC